MNISKKIVICQYCQYFPTQVDQRRIEILQNNLSWTCQACNNNNLYKKQLALLPQNNYLKVKAEDLLGGESKSNKRKYMVVLNRQTGQNIGYYVPLKKDAVERELQLNLNQLETINELQQQSALLREYRKNKAAVQKFIRPKVQNKRVVLEDEYTIYLIDQYLKRQHQRLKGQHHAYVMEVELLLLTSDQTYYFKLPNYGMEPSEELNNFLLINALICIDFQPTWLKRFYSSTIVKHLFDEQFRCESRSKIILMNVLEKHKVNVFPEPCRQLCQQIYTKIRSNSHDMWSQTLQKVQSLRLLPPQSPTFKDYIGSIDIDSPKNEQDSIDIFLKERKSQTIRRHTLTSNLQALQNILLNNRGYNIDIEEESFKKIVLNSIDGVKSKRSVSLIKLIGRFKQHKKNILVLYTFNWSKIQYQSVYQIFQQPQHHLLSPEIQQLHNPFSKKPIPASIIQTSLLDPSETCQNEDDFISL